MPFDVYRDVYGLNNAKTLKNIENNQSILEANRKILLEHYHWFKRNNFHEQSAINNLHFLSHKARDLKTPFSDMNKQDIRLWVYEISDREDISQATKANYFGYIKRLFQDLKGCPLGEYPEEVEWIPVSRGKRKRKSFEDMLSKDEVLRMVATMPEPQYRAITMVIYETGLRVGEILSMRNKHVTHENGITVIYVPRTGKTGSRRVILTDCALVLKRWMNLHPQRDEMGAPLWLNKRGKLMRYNCLCVALVEAAKVSGVKKPVNPHNLRHAACSNLAPFASEAVMREYFGWTADSSMPAVYVHMSGKTVDDAILTARGKKVDPARRADTMLKEIICHNCGATNPPDVKYCIVCNLPPTDAALAEKLKLQNAMMEIHEKLQAMDNRDLEKIGLEVKVRKSQKRKVDA